MFLNSWYKFFFSNMEKSSLTLFCEYMLKAVADLDVVVFCNPNLVIIEFLV